MTGQMPSLSSLSPAVSSKKVKGIKRKITNRFKSIHSIKKLGSNTLMIDDATSTTWLLNPTGEKLRRICGYSGTRGICFQPAGWGTDHPGFAKCRNHERGVMLNPVLSREHNYPANFLELMAHADNLEDNDLLNVDHEIKILYALQQLLLVSKQGDPEVILTADKIEQIQKLTMDLVKTKAIKNKIQREMRLDTKAVDEFVNQIFGIIENHIIGPEAKAIFSDIINNVIVPFRSRDRITGGSIDISAKTDKRLTTLGSKKHGENEGMNDAE